MRFSDQAGYGLPFVSRDDIDDLSASSGIAPGMQRFIDEQAVPGALGVIARRGRVVELLPQGMRDLARQQPMTPDTLFRWYSLTKPITAAATMLLVDQGKLALDSHVADWLPALGGMRVHADRGANSLDRDITVLDLLTHRAGLSYAADFQAWGFSESKARLSDRDLASYVDRLAQFPLTTQPGAEWRFSDGYSVLARLIEVITGQRYSDFLRDNLFKPLGMTDTGYWVPPEKADRLATLYLQSHVDGDLQATRDFGGDYRTEPGFEAGGSGLVGSAADYLRFAQMLLNRGELDGVRILSESAVDAILTDHLAGDARRCIPEGRHHFFTGMGMGLGGYVVFDARERGIAGANGQYRCYGLANTFFWIDPQQHLVGLFFTQVVDRYHNLRDIRNRFHQLAYESLGLTAPAEEIS